MAKKLNDMKKLDPASAVEPRDIGRNYLGGGGDLRDRMRGAYKPNAIKPPPAPLDAVEEWVKKQMGRMKRKDPTSAVRAGELKLPKPSPRELDPTSAVRDGEIKYLKGGRKK